jgi:hypothetical protein
VSFKTEDELLKAVKSFDLALVINGDLSVSRRPVDDLAGLGEAGYALKADLSSGLAWLRVVKGFVSWELDGKHLKELGERFMHPSYSREGARFREWLSGSS